MKVLTAEETEHNNSKQMVLGCLPGIIPRNLTILTHLALTIPHRVETVIFFIDEEQSQGS